VDDDGRHAHERPRRHRDDVAVAAERDSQLAVEHVEEVGVRVVHVRLGAVAARAEARPGRVQRVVLGQDLDAPVGRVADDLAAARRHQREGAHDGGV
jgi:hypothetical protein